MSDRQLTEIAAGFTYTEGPRWHEGRLWFVDFYTHSVNVVNADGSIERVCAVEHQPSGLGWLPDGRMLVVSMKDRKILRREPDGSLVEHADISEHCRGYANDMVVAANGQAYVGEFGFDLMGGADHEHGVVVLVDTDGTSRVAADGLSFPNGMCISPDGKTLYVNELFGNRISRFDITSGGTLGHREDFASFGDLGDEPNVEKRLAACTIAPDGQALDAEGAIWIADCVNQRVVRLGEGGVVLDEVSTAPLGVFAVALGGDDGRTLFLSVAPDFDEAKRSAAREAKVLSTTIDVPHAGRP
ncbi:SMP-30/gluconolactonase/LRE family protein [Rhodococcus opacus]|uniref:SMP-30/gluconolactonase/LRE family protein n=1 Tax=Rhodococcus opacus TaxID=37919 RepID=UPI0002A38E15|nr:SMP-30/gluconolactonase/LRE family protein [Rhodococcus opacus]ELB92258.1 5-valerolactone hydrolase [Rhodococcus wratislaviensis IFP 2016]MBA8964529.1 sugar lactone lactonase YvrE [Rhodococcus opacus]MBP2207509.1 sugar lactone lactonase YvrE [Rhodococcus opacus]MDX5965480.1 SMP-30/gluconolactonase/LRE family protein [Rhodococcus opacus]NKY76294.1 SMP-30/gluconolactonase/LRE family protein [Rhodococcus opacus]